jgi:predicted aldo/keto reductase-like oxidoreductase
MKHRRRTTRRKFLAESSVGIAGAALLPACSGDAPDTEPRPRAGRSVVRTLGRTGIELPVVSMGSAYAANLVQAALDEGIVYIHTSSSYAERNHERLLGQVFRGRPRDSFVVATSPDLPYRFFPGRGRSRDLGLDADTKLIEESLDGSLRRLQLDAVDIFYLCSVGSREVQFEPYIEAFERVKKAGKARAIGIGTHDNEPAVIRAAIDAKVWDVVLTSYNFRQSHREDVRDAIREAADAGLGVVAMKTQAGVYWDRARTRMINMKAALKWVLTDENVHTSIPAFATFDELREGLSVMEDLRLTPEEERDLGLGERLALSGNFCQQCGYCLAQCPAGVDVPTWMRASMYTFGHGQPEKARRLLAEHRAAEPSCTDCDRCVVLCTLGLDVRSSALELVRHLGRSS